MKITKLGHCCLLIEEENLRILTDPGEYSDSQNTVLNIDIILITHEHSDHLHIESLKKVLLNNPQAKIVTNTAVGRILTKENIGFSIVENGKSILIDNVLIEGFGTVHAAIYPSITPVLNTGFFIANKLFYPGDALTDPQKPVEILALPVAGPWLKISESIHYALALKPKICFPVHDGMLRIFGSAHGLPQRLLKDAEIKFQILEINVENLVE